MLRCHNSGYVKSFTTNWGLKIHQSVCVNSISERGTREGRITKRGNLPDGGSNLPPALGRNGYRLHIDEIAFGDSKVYAENQTRLVDEAALKRDTAIKVNKKLKALDSEDGLYDDEEESIVEELGIKLALLARKIGEREVNEFIEILSSSAFDLERFKSRGKSAKDCKLLVEHRFARKVFTTGFRKRRVSDPESQIFGDVYMRSPVSVLRNQICESNAHSTFFSATHNSEDERRGGLPQHEKEFCHAMAAALGKKGTPAIANSIRGTTDRDVIWCSSSLNGVESFVGFLQLYSDKSTTTVKESGFEFYAVHVSLHNFSEEHRRHCIVTGKTTTAYLPVSLGVDETEGDETPSMSRLDRMRLIHVAMTTVLEELREVAVKGFTCEDADRVPRVCHVALGSYCCDLPEAKDMTGVRHGNQSKFSCHRCYTESHSFSGKLEGSLRIMSGTVSVQEEAAVLIKSGKLAEGKELLDFHYLNLQVSCLSKFPFTELDPCLDVHSLFSFEPLHNFHLGISKMLKTCMSVRLKSRTLTSTSMLTAKKEHRPFASIRSLILNGLNKMLTLIEVESPAKGLHVDFSSKGNGNSWNGLFKAEGLMGMLEAKDYKTLDMISPFMAMYVDRCCGEIAGAPNTNVFVQYVEIMQTALRYGRTPLWTESEIGNLETHINNFKRDATHLYADYQASEMCTLKFHMLDHIAEDLRRLGD